MRYKDLNLKDNNNNNDMLWQRCINILITNIYQERCFIYTDSY